MNGMQEQDFEKSVRQTLEPFSLTPSAAVWAGVEAGIRPERRKRRLAPWLLLLTGIAAGGWWAFYANEKPAGSVAASAKQEQAVLQNGVQTPSEEITSNKLIVAAVARCTRSSY